MFLITLSYQPSQADLVALNSLKSAPTKSTPNVFRWYNHIKSFNDEEKKKFSIKNLSSEIAEIISNDTSTQSANIQNKSAAAVDDDVDLFGSDEEVRSENF